MSKEGVGGVEGAGTWGCVLPAQGTSGPCWAWSRNREEARVARAGWPGRGVGDGGPEGRARADLDTMKWEAGEMGSDLGGSRIPLAVMLMRMGCREAGGRGHEIHGRLLRGPGQRRWWSDQRWGGGHWT